MFIADLLIGGADRAASDRATFERRDPVGHDIASLAAAATLQDAQDAAEAAAAAFPSWSATGPSERRALLTRAADLLDLRREEAAARMMAEIGSTTANAARNVMLASACFREAAAITTQITGDIIPSDRPNCLSLAVRQAAGVVLGIAPWNAPLVLGVRAIAVPLACGNSVVLKSSELCPATHRLIGEVCREAGFPPGVVNVVCHASQDAAQIVESLIAHPVVRRVNFTGSSRVGRRIAELAAQSLKPVLLELGGKSPLLVLADADLDAAVGAACFGAFSNQGQICMSTERVIVDETVADEFVRRFSTRARAIKVGDPRDAANHLGGLASKDAVARIWKLIQDAVGQGAHLVCGSVIGETFIAPCIVDHVTSAMDLFFAETFGPVAAIVRVAGDAAAVESANDSEFGLSAAVFSRDTARALAAARGIQSGMCHINGPTLHNEAQAPFGGVKSSGYGQFGSRAEIAHFTELHWITISTGTQAYPF